MEPKMFCYQCQETAGCTGCTMAGVCGKKPDVAAMQDLLVYVTKGFSAVTTALRKQGVRFPEGMNPRKTAEFKAEYQRQLNQFRKERAVKKSANPASPIE